MPLEIKELEINTQIVNQEQSGESSDMKESIIEECIEKILQILKDKEEL